MTPITPLTNPYVGPRTFSYEQRDLFFGREREARDLLARVLSERLLLFYAQSGAGKSSLLHTRLIPQLEEEKGFVVLPVARVSGELPAGVDRVDNIFAYNLMLSIVEDCDPALLAGVTMTDFLARLACRTVIDDDGRERKTWLYDAAQTPAIGGAQRYALIIDQFEEIITAHPGRWHEREAFFRQLDAAMQADPNLWVVLTLREDYVAALDPYAPLLADRLRARFLMEHMKTEAALDAIRKPAELAGRPFAPGVAEKLVNDLRQIRVAGQETTVAGEYVEPVQLEVVCYQLWENLGRGSGGTHETEGTQITLADLAEAGDVDRALTQFYEETLAAVLADPAAAGVSERQLRTWFDQELITGAGTRGLVHQGESKAGNLPNGVVRALQKRFLVRAEARGGDTWIELVHDRFVEPIRQSNRVWFAKYLRPITLAAKEWKDAGRPVSKLYTTAQLTEVQAQMEANPSEFDEVEEEFIRAGSAESDRVRSRRRLVMIGLAALMGVSALLTLLALQVARSNAKRAERDRLSVNQDYSSALASRSALLLAAYPQRSLLLALEAEEVSTGSQPAFRSPSADVAVHNTLSVMGGTPLIGHDDKIVDAAYSPDGRWLATASLDASARLVELTDAMTRTYVLAGHAGSLSDLEFSPDNRYLATTGADGSVRLWSLEQPQAPPVIIPVADRPLVSIAFSPDDRWIAASARMSLFDQRPSVFLLDLSADAPELIPLTGYTTTVTNLRFDPDGQWLAGISTASEEASGAALLWKAADRATGPLSVSGSEYETYDQSSGTRTVRKASVSAIAFSPTGRYLAVADDRSVTRIVTPGQIDSISPLVLGSDGDQRAIRTVSFSPDGSHVVTAGDDAVARVWDLSKNQTPPVPAVLQGHERPILAAVFDSTGDWLAAGSDDGSVRVWNLQDPRAAPFVLRDHEGSIRSLAFNPTASQLLTASDDGSARLLKLSDLLIEPIILGGYRDAVADLAFSPDGRQLAAVSLDGTLRLWESDQREAQPMLLHENRPSENRLSPLRAVAFSPDGRWLAAAGDDGSALLWSYSSEERLPEVLSTSSGASFYDLAFSPDSQLLATASGEGSVALWRLDQDVPTLLEVLPVSREEVRAVAFSPDEKWLATGSSDGEMQLRSRENWRDVASAFKGHEGRITAIAFRPDSNQLATVGEDKVVKLWDVHDPLKHPLILSGHDSQIGAVAYSQDGRLLATGGYDRTTRLWDTSRPQAAPGILTRHQGEVRAVSFSPDGLWLATGGDDGTVQLWINSPERLRNVGCQAVGRNLSEQEWALYFPGVQYHTTCENWPPKPQVIMVANNGQPTRSASVSLSKENLARLRQYPRPLADNGRGLHFDLDLSDESIARTVEHLQSIDAKWTTIYAQDELQAVRAAKASWEAGIMPVVRIGKQTDEPFDPVPWVEALQKQGIPPYVQIYNEPEDEREWSTMTQPENWREVFGRNWAEQAARVADAGGYPGLQVLDKATFQAAVDAVRDIGRTDLWERAFFVQHNYAGNHPPAYPYDERSQLDTPGVTIEDDTFAALGFLAYAKWMDESLGFVLPIIGGEGGWLLGSEDDRRYPKIDEALCAQYHAEMFDWFRTGVLANGEPLPDYLFSVTPWLASSWTYLGQNWWNNPLVVDDKLTETILAVQSIPPFVRRFSWD